jgi:1,4-alpha-glucan branching enzyme
MNTMRSKNFDKKASGKKLHLFLTSLALLWFFGLNNNVFAQVTSDPAFPTEQQPVTIYFDATEGTGGLEGFTGDVYAHTGVLTDQSNGPGDWKYVVADWGENPDKIKLTRIGTDQYQLVIEPSIRAYYGVPEGETIEKIALVFRNADGSIEGKAEGGEDIFVDVFNSTFNMKYLQPEQEDLLLEKPGIVQVHAVASSNNADDISLKLELDGTVIQEVNNDTLLAEVTISDRMDHVMKLSGTDGNESDTLITMIRVNPEIQETERPAGLEDGITYVDDNTVRFSLFAPHKRFVYLLGDFNNWEVKDEYFMHKDSVNADSTWFWIEVDGLEKGKEYAFQYFIDGELRVADPYSEKLLDPANDQYITEEIYPDLKEYPYGKTEHIVGVLQTGQTKYEFKHDFEKPPVEELVIYELLVRDFAEDHDYETLIDTLDYLERLGVNTIELMPVMEFDANSSWGYNPTFHYTTDKYYGPAKDLKAFIDSSHARGIAVILDMVLNHAWGPSPIVRMWNEGDYGKPTAENPYANTEARHPGNVGYDLNHESKATQYYVDRVNLRWIEEFNFDGFRFDLTGGFTQVNSLTGGASNWDYDPTRIRLLKRMADKIWSVESDAYVILEHYTDPRERQELSDYGMPFWEGNAFNHKYSEATMGYNEGDKSDFSGIYHETWQYNEPHLVGYFESHDEERLMVKNKLYGNSAADYDITELKTGLNRMKLAGAFFFTIPGPKMIWQFGELGYDVSIDENGRTGEKPVLWEYRNDPDRYRLYQIWQSLIALRKSHAMFTSKESAVELSLRGDMKRIKLAKNEGRTTIIGNFGVTAKEISPQFHEGGKWYNYFSGDSLNISATDTTIILAPGEFRIYTNLKFDSPVDNLLPVSAEGLDNEIPYKLHLDQNYPNPFNPTTTISYSIPEYSKVTIDVFNSVGQKVKTLINKEQSAGSHQINFDANNISSGIYFYRLSVNEKQLIRKMTLIK